MAQVQSARTPSFFGSSQRPTLPPLHTLDLPRDSYAQSSAHFRHVGNSTIAKPTLPPLSIPSSWPQYNNTTYSRHPSASSSTSSSSRTPSPAPSDLSIDSAGTSSTNTSYTSVSPFSHYDPKYSVPQPSSSSYDTISHSATSMTARSPSSTMRLARCSLHDADAAMVFPPEKLAQPSGKDSGGFLFVGSPAMERVRGPDGLLAKGYRAVPYQIVGFDPVLMDVRH